MSLYGSLSKDSTLSELSKNAAAVRMNLGIVSGSTQVSAGDDTANLKSIVTGLATISQVLLEIKRSLVNVRGDAVVTWTGGTFSIADGSTYSLTANDIVHWVAIGTR